MKKVPETKAVIDKAPFYRGLFLSGGASLFLSNGSRSDEEKMKLPINGSGVFPEALKKKSSESGNKPIPCNPGYDRLIGQ
ncbi:hypothetical protein [Alkalicoccus urumqiensis]|uniref:hypothetical protein n=1 Tax=Alkalicoccus urumqiensis TaxID=1548213 RepID=UPI0015E5EB0B|nr:hypothetical protein [Alkalicoccus urumqiensis]